MKIALCFMGVVGGDKGKSGLGSSDGILDISHKHFKNHVFDKNDVDIFVHSWSTESQDKILQLFKPKKYLIENQIWWDKNSDRNYRMNNHYSKWYSTMKSVELKNEYEKETGVKYDMVMVTRFDIAWQTDIFFEQLNSEHFYAGIWNRRYTLDGKEIKNKLYYNKNWEDSEYKEKLVGYPHDEGGLIDQWWISNNENMNSFANLFKKMDEYRKLGKQTHDHENAISNHRLSLHHLKEIGLINKLEFKFYLHDDFPLIRRWYYKCGR